MIPQNYHMHSNFSCDCLAPMSSMCEAAIRSGIVEIGFTEHLDYHPMDECTDFFRPEAWWDELAQCRKKYSGLTIKAGLEISEPHEYSSQIRDLMQGFEWDFTLGSLHWIGNHNIFQREFFTEITDDPYLTYFLELERMVREGEFHVLAHMDLVKRYGVEYHGPFQPADYEPLIRQILKIMVQREIALEINTIPLRRPINETSPSSEILDWYRDEGGRWVTIGSDAHAPEEIDANLEDALSLVADAGFSGITYFTKGRRKVEPIN
jgi:histidinol-phosphatase (PHP family)